MEKENVIEDFNKMIKESWTYARLTDTEKENWQKTLDNIMVRKVMKGTYKQKWEILHAIYGSFLNALDYFPIGWREKEESDFNA